MIYLDSYQATRAEGFPEDSSLDFESIRLIPRPLVALGHVAKFDVAVEEGKIAVPLVIGAGPELAGRTYVAIICSPTIGTNGGHFVSAGRRAELAAQNREGGHAADSRQTKSRVVLRQTRVVGPEAFVKSISARSAAEAGVFRNRADGNFRISRRHTRAGRVNHGSPPKSRNVGCYLIKPPVGPHGRYR